MLGNNALTSATEDINQIIKSFGNYEVQAVLNSYIIFIPLQNCNLFDGWSI